MDIGDSLVALLRANGPVSALLTSDDGRVRIYPDELPQGPEYPAVRYTLVSETDQYHTRGPANLTRMRFQIDCYGRTKSSANEVARAIRDCLRGFKGAMGDHVAQGIFIDTVRSGRETDIEPPVSFVSRDFIIWVED